MSRKREPLSARHRQLFVQCLSASTRRRLGGGRPVRRRARRWRRRLVIVLLLLLAAGIWGVWQELFF